MRIDLVIDGGGYFGFSYQGNAVCFSTQVVNFYARLLYREHLDRFHTSKISSFALPLEFIL